MTTVAPGTGRRITVTKTKDAPGILVDLLNENALNKGLEVREIDDVDVDSPKEAKAVSLFCHFTDGEKKGKWECIVCTICGGESDENLDYCVYCGDGLEETEAKEEEKSAAESPPENAHSVAELEEAPVASVLAGSPPPLLSPTSALATFGGKEGKMVLYKEKDLDKAVAEVTRLKGLAGAAYWDLGNEVRGIYDKQLWKLRPGEAGKPQKYRQWEAFCNAELGMLPQSAINAMDIAKLYPRETAERIGRSKMVFLVRAQSEEDRAEVQKLIESGATKKQLAERAKKVNKAKREKGEKVQTRVLKENPETGEIEEKVVEKKLPESTRPAKVEPEKITVATLLEKKATVKLWKKPAGKLEQSLENEESLTRAKKLEDEPVGKFELPNSVNLYITIEKNKANELQVKLQFVRETEE